MLRHCQRRKENHLDRPLGQLIKCPLVVAWVDIPIYNKYITNKVPNDKNPKINQQNQRSRKLWKPCIFMRRLRHFHWWGCRVGSRFNRKGWFWRSRSQPPNDERIFCFIRLHTIKSTSSREVRIMSCLQNELLLETIFEEVQEAFPYLDEEKQIEIANNRFQDLCQWLKHF